MRTTHARMSGGLAGFGSGGAVRPTQIAPVDVMAKFLAAHRTIGQSLDDGAVLGGDATADQPLLHVLIAGQSERLGGSDGPTEEADCTGYAFFTLHDGAKNKLEKLASQVSLALTAAGPIHKLCAMETLQERIKRLREERGLTQEQLAELLGLSRQAVQKWESAGEDRTAPTRKREKKLAEALGVSVEELIYGRVNSTPAYLQDIAQDAYSEAIRGNVINGPKLIERTFPLISWQAAGMWTDICEKYDPGSVDAWLPCHQDLGPHGFVLRVQGESMTTLNGPFSFPEGMLLYASPDADPQPGKFVIVRRSGQAATFRRLSSIDGVLYFEALNPAWPQRYAPVSAQDSICGVVVHAGFELP